MLGKSLARHRNTFGGSARGPSFPRDFEMDEPSSGRGSVNKRYITSSGTDYLRTFCASVGLAETFFAFGSLSNTPWCLCASPGASRGGPRRADHLARESHREARARLELPRPALREAPGDRGTEARSNLGAASMFEWWIDWALANCAVPAIATSGQTWLEWAVPREDLKIISSLR